MSRLGYERYAAQGTDVGSGVAGHAPHGRPTAGGRSSPHRHRPRRHRSARPSNSTGSRRPTGPGPNGSTGSATTASATSRSRRPDRRPWRTRSTTRPWVSSPGSWRSSTSGPIRPPRLPDEAVDRDQLLTNVSIFWFTESGASAAHAVYEGMQAWRAFAAQQESADGPRRERAVRSADGGRRLRRGLDDPLAHGSGRPDRALVRVRPGWPLPRDGGPGSARRRHPNVLPTAALSREVRTV